MGALKAKPMRHQCSVRGCRNRQGVRLLTRTLDHSNPIYLCEDCLLAAYEILRAEAESDSPPKVGYPAPQAIKTDDEGVKDAVVEGVKTDDSTATDNSVVAEGGETAEVPIIIDTATVVSDDAIVPPKPQVAVTKAAVVPQKAATSTAKKSGNARSRR